MTEKIQFVGYNPDELIERVTNRVVNDLFSRLERRLSEDGKTHLTSQQVCEKFGITKPTVHEYRKRGILKPRKLGSRVYYRLDEIEDAMITIK